MVGLFVVIYEFTCFSIQLLLILLINRTAKGALKLWSLTPRSYLRILNCAATYCTTKPLRYFNFNACQLVS